MKIDVLCTDQNHPITPALQAWCAAQSSAHKTRLLHDKSELGSGNILFLISCSQLICAQDRAHYDHVLVLHASDLPKGRGWSPHIWDILAGKTKLTLSLLYAEDGVDTGDILEQMHMDIPRHALYDEINAILFKAELRMMGRAITLIEIAAPARPQQETQADYHPRRTPRDSKLDPKQSLVALFDQIRIADPARYPAYFELHGQRYDIKITKRESPSHEDQ